MRTEIGIAFVAAAYALLLLTLVICGIVSLWSAGYWYYSLGIIVFMVLLLVGLALIRD